VQKPRKVVNFAEAYVPPPWTGLAREIIDLCTEISEADGRESKLGILVSNNSWLLRVSTASPCANYEVEAVSLDTLFQKKVLQRSDRLRLRIQIASSTMQLHSTRWLSESWGKCDIFFPQATVEVPLITGGVGLILAPVLGKPFVRWTFDPMGGRPAQVANAEPNPPHHKNLFSLGIILVELCFGMRLQDLPVSYTTDIASDSTKVNELLHK